MWVVTFGPPCIYLLINFLLYVLYILATPSLTGDTRKIFVSRSVVNL